MRETKEQSQPRTVADPPSLDLVFDLLSNQRRRYILYYLNDQQDAAVTVSELVDVVAEHEHRPDGSVSDPDEERDRIKMDIQHVHLPKLEDAGLIEHDQRSETVRYWTQPSVQEWVEHAQYKELS